MAKGNQKAKTQKMSVDLKKGFRDYEEVFDMLIEQAEQMSMKLLVKSLELSKSILQTYKKAWIFKVNENAK
jgi:hypothetical protein